MKMYTVIFYSIHTNELLSERTFSDYYHAYTYAQNNLAWGNYYEIVED